MLLQLVNALLPLLLQLRWALADADTAATGLAMESLQESLGEQLTYYEVLPSVNIVGESSRRIRRDQTSATSGNSEREGIIEVKFSALSRLFHLYLTHDTSIFGEGFEALAVDAAGSRRPIAVSAHGFYSGHVSGEVDSKVQARWDGNSLVARIQTSGDVFYVEPLARVLQNRSAGDASLIYRLSDVKFSTQSASAATSSRCGGGVVGRRRKKIAPARLAKQANVIRKRSLSTEKNTCGIMVIADHLFYKHIADSNENVAANEMIDIISRVDKIYRATDFGNGAINMGFSIKKVLVHTEATSEQSHYNSETYMDPQLLLDALSNNSAHDGNFHEYCLAHLFTARKDFDGVLGMAYIAQINSDFSNGVCAGFRMPPMPDEELVWTNTGWTTRFSRGNKRVLDGQAEVVLAHELGHNWGGNHDPSIPGCGPDRINGSYIMHEFTSDRIQANSKIFSRCSKREIGKVLSELSGICFQVAKDTLRGNYRVDKGEACDAGVVGDQCCSADDFQLTAGSDCSDANSVCCKNCSVSAASGAVCRNASTLSCFMDAVCDGANTTCPELYKEIGSTCLPDDVGRCVPTVGGGEGEKIHCGTICEAVGLKGCLCRDVAHRCHICCQQPGEPCAPLTRHDYDKRVEPCPGNNSRHCRRDGAFSFYPYEWNAELILMKPDTPCAVGYCDTEGVCQKQTHDQLVSFLEFFSSLTPSRAVQFMKDNVVGTIVIFSFILWLPFVMLTNYLDRRWAQEHSADLSYCAELSPQYFTHRNPVMSPALTERRFVRPKESTIPLLSPTARQIYVASKLRESLPPSQVTARASVAYHRDEQEKKSGMDSDHTHTQRTADSDHTQRTADSDHTQRTADSDHTQRTADSDHMQRRADSDHTLRTSDSDHTQREHLHVSFAV